MKYSELIVAINDHLSVLEALVAALPDPKTDLGVIDTRLTALIGSLSPKLDPPATPPAP